MIPTATNMVNTTIEPVSGSRPIGGLGVTPDGSKLYVTDYGGNAVYIIATATNTVTNKQGIRVGAQPNSFGLFIANPPMQSVPASGTACNGVYNGTFNGSLTISAGQDCRFVGGQITGNVTLAGGNFVLSGSSVGGTVSVSAGTYTLGPAATVSGDAVIQNIPTGSDNNSVCGSQISGNLFFDNNGTSVQIGSSSPAVCAGNNIGTSLEANGNTASTLIFNNTVKRNLTASNNTGTLDVVGNNGGGTLTCQNDTNLVMGGGNTAKKRVGQCN